VARFVHGSFFSLAATRSERVRIQTNEVR
jgi:hypothetical protein